MHLPGIAHSGGHTSHKVPPRMESDLQFAGCDIQNNFKSQWRQDQEGSAAQQVRWILATGHIILKFTSLGLTYFTCKGAVS